VGQVRLVQPDRRDRLSVERHPAVDRAVHLVADAADRSTRVVVVGDGALLSDQEELAGRVVARLVHDRRHAAVEIDLLLAQLAGELAVHDAADARAAGQHLEAGQRVVLEAAVEEEDAPQRADRAGLDQAAREQERRQRQVVLRHQHAAERGETARGPQAGRRQDRRVDEEDRVPDRAGGQIAEDARHLRDRHRHGDEIDRGEVDPVERIERGHGPAPAGVAQLAGRAGDHAGDPEAILQAAERGQHRSLDPPAGADDEDVLHPRISPRSRLSGTRPRCSRWSSRRPG
jgi:hypothetical protein